MKDQSVHYRAGQEYLRIKNKSTGDFQDGAICGNGAWIGHIKSTTNLERVTCKKCLDYIKENHLERYLKSL